MIQADAVDNRATVHEQQGPVLSSRAFAMTSAVMYDALSSIRSLVPTLCVGTHTGPLRGPNQTGSMPKCSCPRAAERRRRPSHAERGNQKKSTQAPGAQPVGGAGKKLLPLGRRFMIEDIEAEFIL
jgi:hypothetical protein